ncbi:hypothetical protein [Kribbella sp. NPDC051770]|uniref:hypothetical protein n=1 Tax=Kribbella sp. NPDC051770 TaxID=3155413 RepID=UPI003430E8A5
MSYPPPPPPLNYAPYGGPPKKNRAGLVIVLLIGVVVACVGAAGYIAYDLARGNGPKATDAPVGATPEQPTPVKPSPPKPSVVKPSATKPTVKPTVKPPVVSPKPPLSKPQRAALLARTFVAHLNAGRNDAAGALACGATKEFVPQLIGQMIGPPSKLVVGELSGSDPSYVYQISGTTKGKTAFGVVIVNMTAAPCIQVLNVGTSG